MSKSMLEKILKEENIKEITITTTRGDDIIVNDKTKIIINDDFFSICETIKGKHVTKGRQIIGVTEYDNYIFLPYRNIFSIKYSTLQP